MQTHDLTSRILVVDDESSLRIVLSQVLADDGHKVTVASNGEEALKLFREEPFPLVFTDIVMGKMNGLDLLSQIKEMAPNTQVIIITSHASLDTAISALRSGAYDYLVKPFAELEMISNVAFRAIDHLRLADENSRLLAALKEKNDQLLAANMALKELAVRDGLTGLYNHRYFQEALTVEVLRCRRHSRGFSILFFDVDRFKTYNDNNGHPEGDRALRIIGEVIGNALRASDILARYGGEEFVAILPESTREVACGLGERIRQLIEDLPFPGEASQPFGKLTISLGVATYRDDGMDGSTLMETADRRLYTAKSQGRNCLCCEG
jgi:diguanylate cyclase (GGDEF)-like protein